MQLGEEGMGASCPSRSSSIVPARCGSMVKLAVPDYAKLKLNEIETDKLTLLLLYPPHDE